MTGKIRPFCAGLDELHIFPRHFAKHLICECLPKLYVIDGLHSSFSGHCMEIFCICNEQAGITDAVTWRPSGSFTGMTDTLRQYADMDSSWKVPCTIGAMTPKRILAISICSLFVFSVSIGLSLYFLIYFAQKTFYFSHLCNGL